MADQAFETRIARVLGTYADDAVVPIDASRIALTARAANMSLTDRVAGTIRAARPSAELRLVLIAAALLAALIFGTWLISGASRPRPALVDTVDAISPSATVPTFDIEPLAASLAGTWLADIPDDLSFGDPAGSARMSLVFDGNGNSIYVATTSDPHERFGALLTSPAAGRLVVNARAGSDGVAIAGRSLRACHANEQGTYQAIRSADGLLVTLSAIDDPCPSRAVALARTWVRSLGDHSSGGLGVVDAFDPLVTVEIPAGSYAAERNVPDALKIVQGVPEFQFLAFKDPQGFVDPCDPGAGRYQIASGADPIVTYFRQLRGFTVDSVTERDVDGHRAVRLVVHANRDATCPGGALAEWQPAVATTDDYWSLRPGDTDSLVIVELADATLMFEVLPAPHAAEDAVIDSIRFLDRLPTGP